MTPDSLPFASAVGFALLHHPSNDLEGAPSFMRLSRKGWALPSLGHNSSSLQVPHLLAPKTTRLLFKCAGVDSSFLKTKPRDSERNLRSVPKEPSNANSLR